MRNFNTLLGRSAHKINESVSLVRNSSGKVVVLMLFLLTSVSNLHSQYCLAATTNVAITPGATSLNTAAYSSGCRAFNFVATVGCTYTFATCGLSTADTYLRLYSTGTGGSVLINDDDNCSAQSSFAWTCTTAGTYSVLLTNYSCIALNASTRMSYIRSCPLPGENCTNAIDLATLTSPISATTVGYANDIATCYTGFPDRVYYRDVVNGATITFQETTNNYDEWEYIGYGSSCTATTQIQCWDNDGLAATTWTNSTGSTQRVWYVQDAYSGSGTFTLSWTVVAPVTSCSGTPAAGTATITSLTGCPSTNFTLNSSGLTSGTGISYLWQSSPNNSTWSSTGTTTASYTTSTATTMYYRLKTTCSGSGASSYTNVVSYTVSGGVCACTAYPACNATSAVDDEIFNVTVGTLNNTSTCASLAGGAGSVVAMYSNYSGIVAAPSLTQSSVISGSVTIGFCSGTAYTTGFAVYIDYNQNGVFTDAGEMVYSPNTTFTPAVGGSAYPFTFTVPALATLGTTRMRIVDIEGISLPGSAGTYTWGETEDYCVTITAAVLCSGTPAPGATIASPASVSSGASSILTLTTATIGSNVTYNWQSSATSGGTYVNVVGGTGATTASYTTAGLTTLTWFRCQVTCGANTGTSTQAQVAVTPIANALSFDGSNDRVNCGSAASVDITGTTITLEAWIYPTAWRTSSWEGSIINKEIGSNGGYMLRCGASGTLSFNLGNGGGWYEVLSTTNALTLNTWQHVAGTYDGTTLRLFRDGTQISSIAYNINIASAGSLQLTIGNWSQDDTRGFMGLIDEARIWSVTKSASELTAGMTQTPNPACAAGLRASYNFDQGIANGSNPTVTTLFDATANANNGAVSGLALAGTSSNWVPGKSGINPVAPAGAAPTPVTATPSTICAGATTNLNATTTSPSISWYTVSTGGIAIGSSASGVNFPLTPSVSTTYYAASNTTGCESTRTSVAVTVNSPVITLQPAAPASFCGGSGMATVSVTATSAVTYQWLRNGVAISAAPYSNFTTSILTITNPSAGENGVALTCVVYAAGASCPVTSLPVSLVVSSAPAVPSPVTATSSAICVGQSSLLNATSVGNYINWYTALTSGTLLTSVPSATNYSVTPAVTTTYYAESVLTNVGAPLTATFNYTGAITTWTVMRGFRQLILIAWELKAVISLNLIGVAGAHALLETVLL